MDNLPGFKDVPAEILLMSLMDVSKSLIADELVPK